MKRSAAVLRWLFLLLAVAVFFLSVYRISCYVLEQRQEEQLTRTLAETAVQISLELERPEASEPSAAAAEVSEELVESAPISVDFEAIWKQNKDVVAWIYCADTPVHYPVAQSSDNDYYLRRLLDGTYNRCGTIFLDFRSQPDFSDFNSFLYGHNMRGGTMFGTLVNYRDQAYYDAHPVWYLITPEQSYKVEMIAGISTTDGSEVYAFPEGQEERERYLADAVGKSTFRTAAEYDAMDHFLCLATCAYSAEDARYVLIGKLNQVAAP